MPAVVALDTSALTAPVELDLRVFDELERLLGAIDPIAPSAVERELHGLAEGGGDVGRAARVGLALVADRVRIVESTAAVADDAVLELATDGPATHLVTADRALVERALAAGVPVVSPRAGQHLAIESP